MSDYPMFDAQRRCTKCGGDASVKYQGEPSRSNVFEFWWPWNVIVRRCTRCAFSWYETPLDQAAEPEVLP